MPTAGSRTSAPSSWARTASSSEVRAPPGIAVNYTEGPAANGTPSPRPSSAGAGLRPTARWCSTSRPPTRRATSSASRSPSSRRASGLESRRRSSGRRASAGRPSSGRASSCSTRAEAQELFLQGEDAYSAIWVTAATGHRHRRSCAPRWPRRCPRGTEAATGDAAAARAANRIDEALSFVTTFLLVFAGSRTDGRRVPHRQHLLDPRRPAQPGARPAARHRGEPAAGGEVGARSRRRWSAFSARRSASASGSCSPSASGCCSGGSAWTSAPTSSCSSPAPWSWPSSSGVLVTLAAAYLPARRAGPGAAGGRDARRRRPRRERPALAHRRRLPAPRRRDRRHGRRPCGRRLGAHLRAGRRHLRGARRHRAAQPGARPTGALRDSAGPTAEGSARSASWPSRTPGATPAGRPPPHRP